MKSDKNVNKIKEILKYIYMHIFICMLCSNSNLMKYLTESKNSKLRGLQFSLNLSFQSLVNLVKVSCWQSL